MQTRGAYRRLRIPTRAETDGEGCGTERRRRQPQQGEISTSEYVCSYRVILLTKSLLVARAIESGRPPVRSPPCPPTFPSGRLPFGRPPAPPHSRPAVVLFGRPLVFLRLRPAILPFGSPPVFLSDRSPARSPASPPILPSSRPAVLPFGSPPVPPSSHQCDQRWKFHSFWRLV